MGGLRGVAVALIAVIGAALASAPAALGAEVTARGSAEQVQVTGADPGESVDLLRQGKVVQTRTAGPLGGIVFRRVEPGGGYTVNDGEGPTPQFGVLTTKPKPPSTAIYDQEIESGYGYLTTRDGTELAINVQFPGGAGPYPTLIEYSGYGYANPSGPESGIAPIASLLGFAVVDVNIRGTGCSGGAFDFFEPLQGLDGYDVIETIARQSWVKGGKVGMMGVSYGGISQLFVGQTNPPSLAAIAPMSVIDNTQTTLYPGGILNTGFALEWAQDRVDDAQAAGPNSGQGWAWDRIQNGDTQCAANQELHPEAVNLLQKVRNNSYYRPATADPLNPAKFVHKIKKPVFLACQWTDEQTGGHCANLADRFTGTNKKWITFTNGVHTDALDPETFNRWYDFLKIYVAEEKPALPPALKAAAPALYQSVLGVPGVQVPDDPIQQQPDFASAKAMFEAQPPIRVLFDNGAGDAPGKPVPGFERTYKRFPPPSAKPRSWWFGKKGRMAVKKPKKARGADVFTWNDEARPPTNFTGNTGSGDLWTDHPNYQWSQNPRGTALSYVSGRLAKDTTVLGAGEVQAWVRSKAKNVDLQATVSEVRADGKESFVQGGWLRTGARKVLRDESTLGEPVPDLSKRNEQTLPKGKWVKVRIPLYYQGHVYRKGSRIRVTISAPGGDQPIWAFAEAKPDSKPWVAIARDGKHRSRLVLPVTKDRAAPTPPPPCPGLRGQPCRDYQPLKNKQFGKKG